jgi:hypothetical protein
MANADIDTAWRENRLEEKRNSSAHKSLNFLGTSYDLPDMPDGSKQVRTGIQASDSIQAVNSWRNVRFIDCHFSGGITVRFTDCEFLDCVIDSSDISFNRCQLLKISIIANRLTSMNSEFGDCNFVGTEKLLFTVSESSFISCEIIPSVILSNVSDSVFRKVVVRSPKWSEVRLDAVEFDQTVFNSSVVFEKCRLSKITADRVFLESLGANRGGLTDVDIRCFSEFRDPIADLRMLMGGILFYLHVLTMFLFFAPYLSFAAWKWIQHIIYSGNGTTGEMEPLLLSLTRFAVNGGKNLDRWSPNYSTLSLAAFFLVYNVGRIRAMWKCKSLEHSKDVSGIWPEFSLDSLAVDFGCFKLSWLRLISLIRGGAYLSVVFGIWHAIEFLLVKVPR